ncbi:MAG: oligosaccharide flippase family protein [Bacteroidetes bacterium]|nr:oligosaccharide flippase family protein [Bacteroidota bacterium]
MTENSVLSAPPSRKRATIVNLIRSYANVIIEIIRGIVLIPLYLQFIDSRLYGAWMATGSIVALLGMSDFGLNSVIVQKIASLSGQKNQHKMGGMIGTSLVVAFTLSLLPLIISGIIYKKIPFIVKIDGDEALQLSHAFLIAALATSLMLINYAIGGIFLGLQRTEVYTIMYTVSRIISIIASIIFLISGLGLISLPLSYAVGTIILVIGNVCYLRFWLKRNIVKNSISFEFSYFRELFNKSVWVFLSQFSKTAVFHADKLIVASLIDPAATTILVFSKKASDLMNTIVIQIAFALMPGLANLFGQGDIVNLRKYMIKSIKYSLIFGLFTGGGIFLFNKQFVSLWVGEDYYGGTLLTGLIVSSGLIYVLNTVLYNNLFSNEKISFTSKATLIESFVRIPLSILLCYYFGINGVVFAVTLAVLPTSFFMQTRFMLKISNLSWIQGFRGIMSVFIKACIPIIVSWLIFIIWAPPATLFGFILCGILYSGLSVVFYYYVDNDFQLLILMLLKKIGFKKKSYT